jgi:transposase
LPKKKRQRTIYSETFKARAITLAQQSDRSVSQVARELGIAEKTLLSWVRTEKDRQEAGEAVLNASEKDELKTLRSENDRLREEVAILKKAATYFANQSR